MKRTFQIKSGTNNNFFKKLLFAGILNLAMLQVYAQPGTLDNSFGDSGKVIATEGIFINASALQKDGKIVVAGYGGGSGYDFLLMRYNVNGRIDSSFGNNGKVIMVTGEGVFLLQARDVIVQDDGKIIAAGEGYRNVNNPNYLDDHDAVLIRYNNNGTLDSSFGKNGIAASDFGYDDERAYAVALQPDGRIVMCGGSDQNWLVARYMSDGSLDASFSQDGWIRSVYKGNDQAHSIAVQPDGKIVVGGQTGVSTERSLFILTRYLPDGNADASFGSNGTVMTDVVIGGDRIKSIILQADGKIVAAGSAGDISSYIGDIALVRFQMNGALDSSFGEDGKVITVVGTRSSVAQKVLLQDDGQLIVAGTNFNSDGEGVPADFVTVRYNKDGSLNTHFGENGIQLTDLGGADYAYDALLQPDGKIVVAGVAQINHIALARYNGDPVEKPWFAKIKKWLHKHGFTWDDFPPVKNAELITVERSANGKLFTPVAKLTVHNNNQPYHYEDPAPLTGINYYRLSAVAADGSNIISNVLAIENDNASSIKIYPNPVKNSIQIEGLPSTQKTMLSISDLMGNRKAANIVTGNTYNWNISQLKQGNYLLRIENGSSVITKMLVKE